MLHAVSSCHELNSNAKIKCQILPLTPKADLKLKSVVNNMKLSQKPSNKFDLIVFFK